MDNLENKEINLEQNGTGELYEHHCFVVDKGQTPLRIDKYLANIMPNTSRSRIQEVANKKWLLVNEKPVKSNYKVKGEDVIKIVLAYPPTEFKVEPQNLPLDVVYEDDYQQTGRNGGTPRCWELGRNAFERHCLPLKR